MKKILIMLLIIEPNGPELDKHLQKLVQQKFGQLDKIYRRIKKCVVILKKEINDHKKVSRIDARMLVYGKMLYAGGQDEAFETALHKVIAGFTHQLHRYKNEREEIW